MAKQCYFHVKKGKRILKKTNDIKIARERMIKTPGAYILYTENYHLLLNRLYRRVARIIGRVYTVLYHYKIDKGYAVAYVRTRDLCVVYGRLILIGRRLLFEKIGEVDYLETQLLSNDFKYIHKELL